MSNSGYKGNRSIDIPWDKEKIQKKEIFNRVIIAMKLILIGIGIIIISILLFQNEVIDIKSGFGQIVILIDIVAFFITIAGIYLIVTRKRIYLS